MRRRRGDWSARPRAGDPTSTRAPAPIGRGSAGRPTESIKPGSGRCWLRGLPTPCRSGARRPTHRVGSRSPAPPRRPRRRRRLRPRLSDGFGDHCSDSPAVAGIELLVHHGDGAGTVDGPLIGSDPTGEDIEKGGLAATVLADDRQPRTGGDRDVDARQNRTAAKGYGDAAEPDVGRRAGGDCGRGCGEGRGRNG